MRDDPVKSFWPGDGRAEPDLLVRGLLVEDVAVLLGLDFEDTSLKMVSQVYIDTPIHVPSIPPQSEDPSPVPPPASLRAH